MAAPLYRKAIEDRDVLNDKLLQRGTELESAGFDVQVKVTAKNRKGKTVRETRTYRTCVSRQRR